MNLADYDALWDRSHAQRPLMSRFVWRWKAEPLSFLDADQIFDRHVKEMEHRFTYSYIRDHHSRNIGCLMEDAHRAMGLSPMLYDYDAGFHTEKIVVYSKSDDDLALLALTVT